MQPRSIVPCALVVLAATAAGPAAPPLRAQASPFAARYEITATNPRLNRRVMGPVQVRVHGVPAEPVDSFVYDGVGSTPVQGELRIVLDPGSEEGWIEASWTDENGHWTFSQDRFLHPEHSSGVRMGTSVALTEPLINEGVTQNVYLHGDTTAGFPVLPTVFTYLATWGPADVTLDGRPFDNPFEIPAPQWLAHTMVTEGVRGPDGSVRTIDGGIFNPGFMAEGRVDREDIEAHLVFHDERYPLTTSFPPLYQFVYHLVFENVTIRLTQADRPTPSAGRGAAEPVERPTTPAAPGDRARPISPR